MDKIPKTISLPPKYQRCLYEMAKEVYHYGSAKHITYEQLLQVIFFCSSLRMLYMAYIMALGYPSWYAYQHDVLLSYCRLNAHRFDYSLMIAIYLFNVVYTALEYWIYHIDVERVAVWKWWWQALVLNQQQYYDCLYSNLELEAIQEVKQRAISERLQNSFPLLLGAVREALANLLAKWEIFYNLENVDIEALKNGGSAALLIQPQMSWTLRRRSLRILLITDYIAYGFQLFILTIYWTVIALIVVIYPNWSSHSFLGIFWVCAEVAGAFYVLMRLIRYAILFTGSTFIGAFTMTGYLIEGQAQLEKLLAKYAQLKLPLPLRFKPILEQFISNHNLTCFLVADGSNRLFGNILLGFLYTQIPMNVLFIRRIVFFTFVDPTLTMILSIAVVVQLAISATVFLPFAWCQTVYHSPKRFIIRFQDMTRGTGWLTTKMKYEDLYGRLIRGPKIAMRIGPLAEVTYFSTLEFLLSYIAYLLLAFSTEF